MDQSDDEFFSSIYMLRRSPSAHRIQENPMAAREKKEEKKRTSQTQKKENDMRLT